MYLVAIAWVYVVLMMAVAEAVSSQGTVLGAIITFVLYGVLPLSIVIYVMGSPMRKRARLAAEQQAEAEAEAQVTHAANPAPETPAQTGAASVSAAESSLAPDGGSHAAGRPAPGLLAPERKEV